MCIIAFSGLPQTGKTTLALRLADELQCKFVSFGDFVRQQAVRRGMEKPARHDLQDLGQALVTENVLAFCRQVLETVKFSPGEQIILDGVRHRGVLESLATLSPGQPFILIYLSASLGTRKSRSPKNADLTSIDSHEVESHVEKELKGMANLVIDTNGDAEENFTTLINWILTNTAHARKINTIV